LSWAILQLQADCAATVRFVLFCSYQHSLLLALQLFNISESMHSARLESKRTKTENPILALLDAIQMKSANHVRSYHLQVLLFFIDQHWDIVHDSLKQHIVDRFYFIS
jgi:ataxia telangiectasia mutated family protein